MAVNSKHALADLLDAVQRANGWSDEDVARTARSFGHQLSKSNISRIRNEPVVSVSAKLVASLADGLQLPRRQVIQAALTAMGTPLGEAPTHVEDVVQVDEQLSTRDRHLLLTMIALMKEPPHDRPAKTQADSSAAPHQDPRIAHLEAEVDQLDAEIAGQETRRGKRQGDEPAG